VRRGEESALRRRDIDLDVGRLAVPRGVDGVKSKGAGSD